jgi:hypothetical protein
MSAETSDLSDLYNKIKSIVKLIQIFDDFTVLKKTSPIEIERIVKSLKDPAISKIWIKYEKVIHYLAYYPIKIPGIKRLIYIKEILRLFLLLTLIYYILTFGYILHPKLFPAILNDIKVFFTALSVSFTSGLSLIFLEHRIRSKVTQWESQNIKLLQPQLNKLIEGVNELIKVLLSYVKVYNDRSNIKGKFIIELWRGDYSGLKISSVKKVKKPFSSEPLNVYVYEIA